MHGDTTRVTFDQTKHYSSVRKQQGRVDLDADWNEQQEIDAHLRTATTDDLVGPAGGPLQGCGFGITVVGGKPTIGAGHYYVEGILCECDTPTAIDAQPDLPTGVPVVARPDGSNPGFPPPTGTYLAYLDVWNRHVTALEDDAIREVALGVPDTTTRTKTVWQVRLVRAGDVGAPLTCLSTVADYATLTAASTGTLQARSEIADDPSTPCDVPAGAGYRRTENQHYRVEIHDPGATGTATYKWSRENGSVVARWVAQDANRLTVSIAGRDRAIGFAAGDWIELRDDRLDLAGRPGTMVRLKSVHDDVLEIDPATVHGAAVSFATMGANPKVRRWEDGPQTVRVPGANAGWIDLESGVQIHFDAGKTWHTGDYWSIPARTALGDVVWPKVGSTPVARRPLGVDHHYARLALVQWDGTTWTVRSDCRSLFPPLTGLVELSYVGGDGQTATPGLGSPPTLAALAQPLRAAVTNGATPVVGAMVRFSVTAGNGRLAGGATMSVDLPTVGDGTVSCSWALDPTTPTQQVTATLLDAAATPVGVKLVYTATLLRAVDVAYQPGACPDLAGVATVQQAIDTLCSIGRGGCATLVVEPGPHWADAILALPKGADAHICFRPGQYPLGAPLVLSGFGHLRMCGVGPATLIVARDQEVALRIENCASLAVHDLAVQAGVAKTPNQNGAVTVVGCPDVDLADLMVTSAGGTRRASTCVTVSAAPSRPLERVRVRDCALTVGHLQTGVLVVDGQRIDVSGNTVSVARKSGGLSFERLLQDPRRRRLIAARLLQRPVVAETQQAGGRNTALRVGSYLLAFDSSVPRVDWEAYVAQRPPSEADTASAQAAAAYAHRIIDAAVAEPTSFPGYARQVDAFHRQVGNEGFQQLLGLAAGREVMHRMLVAGDVAVLDEAAVEAQKRTTSINVGTARVLFDSPLTTTAWQTLLAATGVTEAASNVALLTAARSAAEKAIADPSVRERVPGLKGWLQGLADQNPATATSGVVCAGQLAGEVVVTANTFTGVMEAVRVALSHRAPKGAPPDRAGRVRITDNDVVLELPVERELGTYAFLVGNAEVVVVERNRTRVNNRPAEDRVYNEGTRVWGTLGPSVRIADNVHANVALGVQVVAVAGENRPHVWRIDGNVAPYALNAVSAPGSAVVANNSV